MSEMGSPDLVKGPNDPRDSIPTEIYIQVIKLLAKPELAACLRVSTSFYLLASPLLYKEIELDLNKRPHLLSYKPNLSLITGMDMLPNPKIPNPFIHTTHLIVHSHTNECYRNTTFPPFIIPNLRSLRIVPSDTNRSLDACSFGQLRNDHHQSTCCPLPTHLRPKQVEIGGLNTGFVGTGAGLWTTHISSFPPPWLEYLVLRVGWRDKYSPSSTIFGQMPNTVKRLTYILPSTNPEDRKQYWKFREGNDLWKGDAQESWVNLVETLCGRAQEIEIVGVESLNEEWGSWSREEAVVKARGILSSCCERLLRGQERKEVGRVVEKIIFTELDDFLARQRLL